MKEKSLTMGAFLPMRNIVLIKQMQWVFIIAASITTFGSGSWMIGGGVSAFQVLVPQAAGAVFERQAVVDNSLEPQLMLLSNHEPLLLVSHPAYPVLLTPEECQLLSDKFSSEESGIIDNQTNTNHQDANLVLQRLQQTLDKLIGRDRGDGDRSTSSSDNNKEEDEEDTVVVPRFLNYEPDDDHNEAGESYTSTSKDMEQIQSPAPLVPPPLLPLLPDGLHVDTNNGYLFRYLTVLVYLTTSHHGHGATTFPLVNVVKKNVNNYSKSVSGHEDEDDASLLESAKRLLDANVMHTKSEQAGLTRELQDCQDTLEQAAIALKRNHDHLPQQRNNSSQSPTSAPPTDMSMGLRVVPQAGHCTVFSSILTKDGTPDPRSWHGSEHVYCDKKQVLSFFYEIPSSAKITSQRQFGQECHKRYERLLERTSTT
jgi:hypothetical protein